MKEVRHWRPLASDPPGGISTGAHHYDVQTVPISAGIEHSTIMLRVMLYSVANDLWQELMTYIKLVPSSLICSTTAPILLTSIILTLVTDPFLKLLSLHLPRAWHKA